MQRRSVSAKMTAHGRNLEHAQVRASALPVRPSRNHVVSVAVKRKPAAKLAFGKTQAYAAVKGFVIHQTPPEIRKQRAAAMRSVAKAFAGLGVPRAAVIPTHANGRVGGHALSLLPPKYAVISSMKTVTAILSDAPTHTNRMIRAAVALNLIRARIGISTPKLSRVLIPIRTPTTIIVFGRTMD